MKVVLTDEAVRDLEQIGAYIARGNPSRAPSFIDELIESARGLSEMPERFPLVPRYAHLGIRRRVNGNYLIFYRVEDDRVVVLHILHGARDYDALIFPDDDIARQ